MEKSGDFLKQLNQSKFVVRELFKLYNSFLIYEIALNFTFAPKNHVIQSILVIMAEENLKLI